MPAHVAPDVEQHKVINYRIYFFHSQVQSTEVSTANSTTDLETLNNPNTTPPSGDSADPQSIGALARAMRTQCAQLVGHTLVLIRNLVEACQKALRDRAALPGT